jgi:hypothetical protein
MQKTLIENHIWTLEITKLLLGTVISYKSDVQEKIDKFNKLDVRSITFLFSKNL